MGLSPRVQVLACNCLTFASGVKGLVLHSAALQITLHVQNIDKKHFAHSVVLVMTYITDSGREIHHRIDVINCCCGGRNELQFHNCFSP